MHHTGGVGSSGPRTHPVQKSTPFLVRDLAGYVRPQFAAPLPNRQYIRIPVVGGPTPRSAHARSSQQNPVHVFQARKFDHRQSEAAHPQCLSASWPAHFQFSRRLIVRA